MDPDTLQMILREAVRETATEVLQVLLNADREAFLREHGERKNGYYPRKLETAFGQVHLKVPRDREGRYYPAFLHPYARRQVDLGEVAVTLYTAGVRAQGGGGDEPALGPPLPPRDHQRPHRPGAEGGGGLPP